LLAEFYPQPAGKFGRTSACRGCESERGKKSYGGNKEKHRAVCERWRKDNLASINQRMRGRRDRLDELKSKPCADCGGTFPPYVMDFDHRDPSQKSFTISKRFANRWERLLEEIAKCDVVCANCHRVRTYRQLQSKKNARRTA
jgi:hypothetical protein